MVSRSLPDVGLGPSAESSIRLNRVSFDNLTACRSGPHLDIPIPAPRFRELQRPSQFLGSGTPGTAFATCEVDRSMAVFYERSMAASWLALRRYLLELRQCSISQVNVRADR